MLSGDKYSFAIADVVLDQLKQGQECRLKIVSDSMSPFLKVDDFVIIERKKFEDLRFGDVLVFFQAGDFCVHRLLKKSFLLKQVVTKGDAVWGADQPISAENILGCVATYERKGKMIKQQSFFNFLIGIFSYLTWIVYERLRLLKHAFVS